MKKLKVLLYNICYRDDMPTQAFVPLAYLILEEYLNIHGNNLDVVRYDYIIDDFLSREIDNYETYDMVGISFSYGNADYVMNMIDKWEAAGNRPFIVLGGVLASAIAMELINQYKNIDAVVVGEGEETLLQLTGVLQEKLTLSDVPGIVYRNGSESATYNDGKRPVGYNSIPRLNRNFLSALPAKEIKRTSIRFQTARGCMGGCTFCNNSYKHRLDKLTTKAWRGMGPERVVDEIKEIYDTYGVQIINFVDPSFEDPGTKGKKRIRTIANLLIEKDIRISFKINMRAETFTDDDLELLRLLKRAGLDILILGVEAGNDPELKLFGKNADSETTTQAYWRLSRLECFFVIIGYITFHPYSTLESLSASYDYLAHLGESYSFDIFSNALIPLRGTDIYARMKEDNLITNAEDILSIPRYRFVDERVASINEWVQTMKLENPALMDLNMRIWDAHNIIARSTNRAVEHILDNAGINTLFNKYKASIEDICHKLGKRYYGLQKNMLDMAEKGKVYDDFKRVADRDMLAYIPEMMDKIERQIDVYFFGVRSAGYDTSMMELRAWGTYCSQNQKIGN